MKHHRGMLWGLILLGSVGTGVASDVPAVKRVVFSDDFSVAGLLAEKWKLTPSSSFHIADGSLMATGGTCSAAPASITVDGPVQVRCRIKATSFGPKPGGWVGVGVCGVNFMLQPAGFWHVYRLPDVKRSLGGIKSSPPPELNRWYEFRIVKNGDFYQWFVDEVKVAEFREPNTVVNATRLFAVALSGGGSAVYDDVTVEELSNEPVSPNFLRNASFEDVPDQVPTYWKPDARLVPPEGYWARWGVDANVAWHGRQSLRIQSGEGITSFNNSMAVGKPCTFSVYLKADQPDLKAQLIFWQLWLGKWNRKTVLVGTNWSREAFTLDYPSNTTVRVGVKVEGKGTLWVDAAQLELGTNVSPFELSSSDVTPVEKKSDAVQTPAPMSLVESVAPVVDGKLDDSVWNDKSKVWPLVLPGGKVPGERTDAYMVLADGTLYVGMRCADSRISGLLAKTTQHDGPVYTEDSVELLLDTSRDKTTYYHLAVNALGTTFDAAPGRDMSWNGGWTAKTFVGDDYWSVEIALPLSIFSPGPRLSKEWGVNLCRSNPRAGECSSTALGPAPTPNYHVPGRFPVLQWPAQAFDACLLYPENLELTLLPDNTLKLAGSIINRTGRPRTVVVSGRAGDANWSSAPLMVPVAGEAPFVVPGVNAKAGQSEVRIEGTIREAGEGGRCVNEFAQRVAVARVLDGVLERSFYSMETTARFIAQIRLPDDALAQAGLSLTVGSQTQTWSGAALKRYMSLDIALEGLPVGSIPLVVALVDSNRMTLGEVHAVLEKRPPAQSNVPLDRARRCLIVDDQPYFAFAQLLLLFPHMKPGDVDLMINHQADNGFRSVMVVGKINEKGMDAVWARIFDRCAARGLKIIAWPGGFLKFPVEGFRSFIEQWRQHPSLVAWLPVDEPELYTTGDEVIKALDYFKQQDPRHPVYMNNTMMGIPSRFAGLAGDIVSIDDYLTNREGRSVKEIVHQVDVMELAARPTRRPVYMFLTGNNLHNHYREPTPCEQVAETYGCAIAGASGLIYFCTDPAGKQHWLTLRQLNREFGIIGPVLLSPEPAPVVTCSDPNVRYAVRRVGAQIYVIASNQEPVGTEVKFTITGVPSADVVVLFEERVASISEGTLQDTFGPHERHVYRFEMPAKK